MTEHLFCIYDNTLVGEFIRYDKIGTLTELTPSHISMKSRPGLWLAADGGPDERDQIECDLVAFQRFLKSTIFNSCSVIICDWDLQFDVSTAGIEPVVFWPQGPMCMEDIHAIIAGGRILHEINVDDITDDEGLQQLCRIGRFANFNTTREIRNFITDFLLHTRLHLGTVYEAPQKTIAV